MSSLPNAPFDSDAARELCKLKRGFVLDLHLRRGCFWQSISGMRTEWAVTPTTSLPPRALSEACPENWPGPADFSRKALELNNRWWFAIDEIRDLVVPAPYNDWQYFGPLCRGFISICIIYDPPETELLSFAARGGPRPYEKEPTEPSRIPLVMLPAVRQERDWIKSADAERYYYHEIIREVAKRLQEWRGIDLWPVINEVLRDLGPRLQEDLREWEEQDNPFRWIIDPEVVASRDDVVKTWRFARSYTKPGGRPPMDKLVAVQCAILYDDYNSREPEDGRLKKWTHEKLAVQFREYGVKDARSAEEHIKVGREYRSTHNKN